MCVLLQSRGWWLTLITRMVPRDGSRAAATLKMERFVIIVNGLTVANLIGFLPRNVLLYVLFTWYCETT